MCSHVQTRLMRLYKQNRTLLDLLAFTVLICALIYSTSSVEYLKNQSSRYKRNILNYKEEKIDLISKSQWIVITSISHPTSDVKFMAKSMPEWQILVVADAKTPKNWSYPGCIFLSVEQQQKLGNITPGYIQYFLKWNLSLSILEGFYFLTSVYAGFKRTSKIAR